MVVHTRFADANTVGSIAAIASIDWGCAVQIMAAASIGSINADGEETLTATNAQLLSVFFCLVNEHG